MDFPLFNDVIAWCRKNENIRAAVLTSSRARNDKSVDDLSDFDLELYVDDLAFFSRSDDWLKRFGPVMVSWPLTPLVTFSDNWITRLVQYEDGTRIDFQITALELAYHESFDAGYKVIVDKEGLGGSLPPARSENLLIAKPTEEEYADRVNAFFWDILYVPKALKRDELFFARYQLDSAIRYEMLLPMLEWYVGLNHGWKVGTNKIGRKIKPYLPEDIWSLCEKTFAGAGKEENSRATWAMVKLFCHLAREVGAGLGFAYPEKQEEKVRAYMEKIENTTLLNNPAPPV